MGGCQSSTSGGNILSNNATNKTNTDNVKNIIRRNKNESTAFVVTDQEVSIIEADDYDDSLSTLKCHDYNFLGMKMGEYYPYGASYNITQTSGLKMVQLNKFDSQEVDNIYTKVTSKLKSDLDASLGSSGGKVVKDAINDASAQTKSDITSYLNQIADKTIDQSQKIEIIQKRPFRYQGECGENKPLEINQNIVIDVVAQNIVNIIVSDIQKKLVEQGNSGELKSDSTGGDLACEETIGIGVICCLICLGVLYMIYRYMYGSGSDSSSDSSSDIKEMMMKAASSKV